MKPENVTKKKWEDSCAFFCQLFISLAPILLDGILNSVWMLLCLDCSSLLEIHHSITFIHHWFSKGKNIVNRQKKWNYPSDSSDERRCDRKKSSERWSEYTYRKKLEPLLIPTTDGWKQTYSIQLTNVGDKNRWKRSPMKQNWWKEPNATELMRTMNE